MKPDIFYVGIENPSAFRRSLLETSKELIQALQSYERLRSVRAEKYAQMAKLRAVYQEIVSLMADLRAELPKVDVKSLPRAAPKPVAKQEPFVAVQQQDAGSMRPVRRKATVVDRLEVELNEIEQKLKLMG